MGEFEGWMLGSMSSGVLGIDRDGAIQVLNAGAQQVLGCPAGAPEAALGHDCRRVLAAQPGVVRLLLEALERKSPVSRAELSLEGGATIGLTLAPVRDAAGRVCGAGMIFRDLAPLERQDEQARLRERLAALGQMAAGLAHAIRNPLAGMEVVAGLLRRRLPDDSEERALLDEITGEMRTVSRTVTQSLEYVRPAAPELQRVDAVRLLESALELARARTPFEGVVERAWQDGLPALEADADQLSSALVALLGNALEAMAGRVDARLSLSARAASGDVLVLSIGDDGPGVAPELREKIFYPFFTTKDEGSGVGLAHVQKVVTSHGGRIELESAAGAGCVFHVRLPSAGRAPR